MNVRGTGRVHGAAVSFDSALAIRPPPDVDADQVSKATAAETIRGLSLDALLCGTPPLTFKHRMSADLDKKAGSAGCKA